MGDALAQPVDGLLGAVRPEGQVEQGFDLGGISGPLGGNGEHELASGNIVRDHRRTGGLSLPSVRPVIRGHAGSCLATGRNGVWHLSRFSAREQPPGTAFVAVRRDAVVGIATGGSLLCSAPLCRTGSIAQPPGGRKPDLRRQAILPSTVSSQTQSQGGRVPNRSARTSMKARTLVVR